MKKAILALAVLCGIGFGASAQSVDTTKVRPADTLERLKPQISAAPQAIKMAVRRLFQCIF